MLISDRKTERDIDRLFGAIRAVMQSFYQASYGDQGGQPEGKSQSVCVQTSPTVMKFEDLEIVNWERDV